MRYFIKPKTETGRQAAVLPWLLNIDTTPTVLPIFPDTAELGLVVAHLLSGEVFAEVIPSPEKIVEICGPGLPLGRLYFQIPKDLLYSACTGLDPTVFGGQR